MPSLTTFKAKPDAAIRLQELSDGMKQIHIQNHTIGQEPEAVFIALTDEQIKTLVVLLDKSVEELPPQPNADDDAAEAFEANQKARVDEFLPPHEC